MYVARSGRAGERRGSFDRVSHSFYDVKLVSPERGGEAGSLRADEIKRDDSAIHASFDGDGDDATDALGFGQKIFRLKRTLADAELRNAFSDFN